MVRLSSFAALASAASLVAAAPVAPRQTCYSGFYMIVARGSNEAAGEGAPGAVADLIAAAVPDSASIAVDYPATIVSTSGTEYPESVIDGINDTIDKIQSYVDACGSASRIVLLGYSQGGNVMTDALAGGVFKPDPIGSDLSPYISGVVVWGDPTYTPGQSFDAGGATSGGLFERSEGGSSLALLSTYSSVLRSYCNVNDIVCGSGTSTAVHDAEVSDHTQDAVDFIVSLA